MTDIHEHGFARGWSEADMSLHVDRDIVLGCADPLAGFLIIRPAADQAELLTIAITPDERRKGHATSLLKAGEAATAKSGADILFLEVAEDNPEAISFYRQQNYQEFARRPGYYKRPKGRVAALLFRKQV